MNLEQEVKKLRRELAQYEQIFQGEDDLSKFSLVFKAPAQLTAVIRALYLFPIVSTNALISIANTHGHSEEHDPTYARMMIYRVRKVLNKHNIKVECRPVFGYAIDTKAKMKIKGMLSV